MQAKKILDISGQRFVNIPEISTPHTKYINHTVDHFTKQFSLAIYIPEKSHFVAIPLLVITMLQIIAHFMIVNFL